MFARAGKPASEQGMVWIGFYNGLKLQNKVNPQKLETKRLRLVSWSLAGMQNVLQQFQTRLAVFGVLEFCLKGENWLLGPVSKTEAEPPPE